MRHCVHCPLAKEENINRKTYLDRTERILVTFWCSEEKMELSCAVQNYAWGKPGSSSEVALLRSSADPDFAVEEGRPYAELWMGTHPNGPSLLKTDGEATTLKEHISGDKSALGEESRARFGDDLPFLFKVREFEAEIFEAVTLNPF